MDVIAHEVTYARERFPLEADRAFARMFRDHGLEVRDKPLVLAYGRYWGLDNGGRLGWFVARCGRKPVPKSSGDPVGPAAGYPVGYSGHWSYISMHGPELLGHDDLWYVDPRFRGRGIGARLKRMGHDWLKSQGCAETSDFVRYVPAEAMQALGFQQRGIWWVRGLDQPP